MVTRIRKGVRPRLYIPEWMEKKSISAEMMAGRLDIERESVYRLIREQHRINMDKLGDIAHALGIEVSELFFAPERRSVDAILQGAPDTVREAVTDVAERLVGKSSGR